MESFETRKDSSEAKSPDWIQHFIHSQMPASSDIFWNEIHSRDLKPFFGLNEEKDEGLISESISSPTRTIEIEDVGKSIGWWQKDEYEKLGIKRILLGKESVQLELSAPISKHGLFTQIDLDKRVSFDFHKTGTDWTMHHVSGLKINGERIVSGSADKDRVVFRSYKMEHEFSGSAWSYIRALFDPLMDSRLHKSQ